MSKIDKDLIDPIVEPEGEKAHRLTRAALSSIPVLGGSAVEAFNALIEPPMARRKTQWMIDVTEAINELFEKGLVPLEELLKNEKFFTTLVHASNIAIRNHQQQKLDALKNAVLNSALPDPPDDTLQQLFLNFVDSCTSWHIALLKLFKDPKKWAEDNDHTFPGWSMAGLSAVIESAFPNLLGQQDMCRLIWQELYRNGLINTEHINASMSAHGLFQKRTTVIGDKFILFISEPTLSTE